MQTTLQVTYCWMLTIAAVLSGSPALADSGFKEWVSTFKAEAHTRGITTALLEQAFHHVTPLPQVLKLDRRQAASTITFRRYRHRTVTPKRIEKGRQMLRRYRTLLHNVGRDYGIPPRMIVALWGVETDYGQHTGTFNVVAALATLAYDGRRSQYFRAELHDALKILQEGHIPWAKMKGSWAGAMGQCQFMPSSFLRYAVDYDGDGRKDIWSTSADVVASAANYLSQSGWQERQRWGRQAKLPRGFVKRDATLDIRKSLTQWRAIGVRRSNGQQLPQVSMLGSIVLPDGQHGPAYLVYDNFRVIMKWNRSQYFALSVGLLADAVVR